MKLIIAGSRHFKHYDYDLILSCLNMHKLGIRDITEVISGRAFGIDKAGEQLADKFDLPLSTFPADWDKHGKAAGPIRNKQMAEYADALLLIWDGKSRGSNNMLNNMRQLGKPVYEVIIRKNFDEEIKE
jgi:hypothetical protein